MGYRGKVVERERARELRAESWTLQEIADELGVAKGSVSVWVRDVEFTPKPRNRGHSSHRPHPLTVKKEAELSSCRAEAIKLIGALSDRDLEMYCLALYAGEGAKADGGGIVFANSDTRLIVIFLHWLRSSFEIDETRLRMRLYLHAGLDLDRALDHWVLMTGIPLTQFNTPYRAVADATIRRNKHAFGCATVVYRCALTHRRVMARIEAISSRFDLPG